MPAVKIRLLGGPEDGRMFDASPEHIANGRFYVPVIQGPKWASVNDESEYSISTFKQAAYEEVRIGPGDLSPRIQPLPYRLFMYLHTT